MSSTNSRQPFCVKRGVNSVLGGLQKNGQQLITEFFGVARAQIQRQRKDDYLFFPADMTAEELMTRGGRAVVTVNGKEIALLYYDTEKEIYAVQAKCPHMGAPLVMGDIEEVPGCGPCVNCPQHHYRFNLTNGECSFPKHQKGAEVFPVRVESKQKPIQIGFTAFSEKLFSDPPE